MPRSRESLFTAGLLAVALLNAACPSVGGIGTPLDGGLDIQGDGAARDDGSAADASTAPGDAASATGCAYATHATGLRAYQQAGGLAFHVYAPSSYNPSIAHTVIVLMHGQDSDGTSELNALWKPLADTEQLILVAPKGSRPATNPITYPTGANWSVNDLNAVQDLVTEIDACYNVNPKKHILWGFSEGGFYGYLLGIGAATQFSGLAMGGSNASFARQNGYPPASAPWKIPVSHVQGSTDPNGLAPCLQDQSDFQAVGSVFSLYQPAQGHTITAAQVAMQYNDLKGSSSP